MVPVGGGSGAAGACVVAKAVRPSVEVIGVQSSAAPAAYRSWQAGTLVEDSTSTFAEGLATRTAFELPQRIMRALLDDFVLVSEDALKAATRLMIEKTRNLVGRPGRRHLRRYLAHPGGSRAAKWRSSAAAATSAQPSWPDCGAHKPVLRPCYLTLL